ncbi:endonuclease [Phage C48C1]|nr:endonuclease [Phage C48C1]
MYKYEATIRRWVDGDTVDVDIDLGFGIVFHNQRIRLYGIDAYESRTRDLEEKSKGLAAKEFVNEVAPVGSKVTLVTYKESKGKYGRILGEIFIDGDTNLNKVLTEKGHAVRYEI